MLFGRFSNDYVKKAETFVMKILVKIPHSTKLLTVWI